MDISRGTVKAFMHIAEKGNIKKVDYYLKSIPIDSTDDQSHVALHYAAANGHEDVVRHLIKKGAKLDCKNWCGWTPLMFAAYYGHANVVTLLAQSYAQVNVENDRLATPLICAARCGHKGVVEILLESGAEINADAKNKASATSLMAAAQHEHYSIVDLLLQYSVDVDYQNLDTGYTALMLAAINGNLDIVELLISKGGADPNITNISGQTAYDLSMIKHREDVAAYLYCRTKKSDHEVINVGGQPNLIEVVKSGEIRKALKAVNQVDDVNVKDSDGATPLIYASMGGHIEIVRALLQRGADTDVQDNLHGWTALMQATVKRYVEIVKLLLQKGARVNIKNNNGLMVFDLAALVGIPEITRLVTPSHGSQSNDVRGNKGNVKTFFSKFGDKMGINKRTPNSLTRVAVLRSDILSGSAVGDDMPNQEDDVDELKKTSSVLSIFDANNSLSKVSAKARISLLSPQVKLPDDIVAPVLPPYLKLPSFDLPKMSIMGTKLSNSYGSNGEVSPYNNSYDSESIKAIQTPTTSTTQHASLKRPQMTNTASVSRLSAEPESPQSSMTSSEFTSVSRHRGPGIMPEPLFKKKNTPFPQTLQFSKQTSVPWSSPIPNGYASPPPMLVGNAQYHEIMVHPQKQQPRLPPLHDLSLKSVHSDGDIESLLKRLSLEKYRSAFEEEEVDLETLKEMDDDDLKLIGIDQTINRDKILTAVNSEKQIMGPTSRRSHSVPITPVYYQPVPPSQRRPGMPSINVFN